MTMMSFTRGARTTVAMALCLALAACGDRPGALSNMFGGSKPAEGVATTLPRPDPDARGVITYQTYQVMVARQGDTIPAMAERVGLTATQIAQHNGLPVTYRPRPGEVLALPEDVGGTPALAPVWSTDIASSAIDSAPDTGPRTATGTTTAANPFNNGQPSRVIDPVRHRVEPGETAFSIARLYGVSVTALASWNGLDSQMTVRENQELLIPVANAANSIRPAGQTGSVAAANPPGTPTPIPPPPSAQTPLPENEDTTAATPPPSPNLATERTEPTPAPTPQRTALRMPMDGARLLSGYAPDGTPPNEGVDLGAPAGTPVLAAEAGEVALISESIGGLGTILLIRHADGLITVYTRIEGVTLGKGDTVERGQKVGVVADGDNPYLHFEVRRGTASIDPGPYLNL